MSREFESLSRADMKALALARDMGIAINKGAILDSQETPDSQLPQYSLRPAREVSRRQVRDQDGKTWKARDAGQLFAQHSFIDRKPE